MIRRAPPVFFFLKRFFFCFIDYVFGWWGGGGVCAPKAERGGEGFDPSVLAGHARTDMGGGKGVYQHRGSLSATGPSMKLTLFA